MILKENFLSTGFGEIDPDFEQIDSSEVLDSDEVSVILYSDDPIVTLYSEVFLNDFN